MVSSGGMTDLGGIRAAFILSRELRSFWQDGAAINVVVMMVED